MCSGVFYLSFLCVNQQQILAFNATVHSYVLASVSLDQVKHRHLGFSLYLCSCDSEAILSSVSTHLPWPQPRVISLHFQQLLHPQPRVPSPPSFTALLRLMVPLDPSRGWLNTRGFWDLSLWATVMKIASTWSLFPLQQPPPSLPFGFLADVSNRGMEWTSANCCATSVPTWMESWRSHLLPTRILGTSVPRACCLHSSIQAGRLWKLAALVTS